MPQSHFLSLFPLLSVEYLCAAHTCEYMCKSQSKANFWARWEVLPATSVTSFLNKEVSRYFLPKFSVKSILPTCIHNKKSIVGKDKALLLSKDMDISIWS